MSRTSWRICWRSGARAARRNRTSAAGANPGSNLGLPQTGGGSATAGGGGGSGSPDYTDSEFQVDQAGATGSPTYGALSGSINGSNTTFTVSAAIYISGTLIVFLNGVLVFQGTSSNEWQETTPGSGTFDFGIAPPSGSAILVMYRSE